MVLVSLVCFFSSSFNPHWHSDRQQQTSDIWKMLDWNMHRRYITQMDWISNAKTKFIRLQTFECFHVLIQQNNGHKNTKRRYRNFKTKKYIEHSKNIIHHTPKTQDTQYQQQQQKKINNKPKQDQFKLGVLLVLCVYLYLMCFITEPFRRITNKNTSNSKTKSFVCFWFALNFSIINSD